LEVERVVKMRRTGGWKACVFLVVLAAVVFL
jgi:uncharacterized membrane protein